MSRQILINADKTFVLTVPDDSKITFGPFSPPAVAAAQMRNGNGDLSKLAGTIRVYKGKTEASSILCMYTNVHSFRDLTNVDYEEFPHLPICSFCKQNMIEPGEDLCRKCNGKTSTSPPDDFNLNRGPF